jgi:vesicle transport through interaction with t-SNAREs protein 1
MASSAGGSELFSNYEQDFTSLTEGIKIKIEKQIANQTGGKANSDIRGSVACKITVIIIIKIEERKATIRAVEREIDEADEIVNNNNKDKYIYRYIDPV